MNSAFAECHYVFQKLPLRSPSGGAYRYLDRSDPSEENIVVKHASSLRPRLDKAQPHA
jgi:hypothetical protein